MDRAATVDFQIESQAIKEAVKKRSFLLRKKSEQNQGVDPRNDIPLWGHDEAPAQTSYKIKPRNDLVKFTGPKDYKWLPQDWQSYDQKVSSRQFEKNTFLTIPWAILCNKRFGATLEIRVLLAILAWTADEFCDSRLSDGEIEIKRGPRPIRGRATKNKLQPNAPIRLLNQLESDKLISISNRQGRGRVIHVDKTAVAICRGCQKIKKGQLLIRPAIFLLNLTTPQKIILTSRLAFQEMSIPKMARRLGLSEISIKTHHLYLIRYKNALIKLKGVELLRFINGLPEPLIKLSPTLNKAKYRYILGIDINHKLLFYNNYDLDRSATCNINFKKTSLYQERDQKPSLNENNTPALKQENSMASRIAYDDPMTHAELESAVRRARQSKAKNNPRNDLRPKKKMRKFKPTDDGRYEKRYIDELEYIREQCPLINVSKPGTWIYDNALGIVRALTIGPAKALRWDVVNAILSVMVGKQPGNLNYPLSKEYIMRNFLDRSFSDDDRIELYARLNNMQSAEFKGNGKKVELAWAMCSNNNYSWLLHLWFTPPRRPREEFPPDLGEYRQQYERALGLMPVNMAKEREGQLAWTIKALRKRYIDEFRDRRPAGYNGNTWYGTWPLFFKELAEHFDRKDVDIWPGWFNPNGQLVKDFLAEAGFREAGRPGCRPRGYNRGREEEHARA